MFKNNLFNITSIILFSNIKQVYLIKKGSIKGKLLSNSN